MPRPARGAAKRTEVHADLDERGETARKRHSLGPAAAPSLLAGWPTGSLPVTNRHAVGTRTTFDTVCMSMCGNDAAGRLIATSSAHSGIRKAIESVDALAVAMGAAVGSTASLPSLVCMRSAVQTSAAEETRTADGPISHCLSAGKALFGDYSARACVFRSSSRLRPGGRPARRPQTLECTPRDLCEAWATARWRTSPTTLFLHCGRSCRPPTAPFAMPARSGASTSSMYTSTSFRSSWLGSSPPRQSPTRNGASNRRETLDMDPYESPSRQMQLEFNLMLSRSDRDFNDRLDQAAAERAKIHNEQLALAAREHERIQEGAKLEIQRIILEKEQERQQREEAQRREVERLNQEKAKQQAEAHQRALEAKRREEEAAQQAAQLQRQLHEAEARVQVQKAKEDAERRQKLQRDEAERRAKAAAAAAAVAAPTPQLPSQQPQPQATRPPPAATATPLAASAPAQSASPAGIEELHAKYLQLHARMKQFRVAFETQHKQKGNPLKAIVGDARRNVRLRMGQINVERESSKQAIGKLRDECFNLAISTPGPSIDIRPFIVSHEIPALANESEAQYPAFLLYIWLRFVKALLKQFDKEAAAQDGRIIQEIGLIAASLFADQRYFWKGIPLTDLLLAKYHKICPILFGIRGTMATAEGRVRLGWIPIDKAAPTANSYAQRMRGLGAGYAALSLRQFSGKNPAIPMSEYWRAIAMICNTPTNNLGAGHFAVLQGLVGDYAKKFVAFYGIAAKAVLRRVVIDLPARAPANLKESADQVKVLADGWKVNERFTLA